MTWTLFIEPVDVLIFRDGKPFQAGEDHRARTLFPPTPFTLQGAIRAKVLFSSRVSPSDYAKKAPSAQTLIQQIGDQDSYGQLNLSGPFVSRLNCDGSITRFFPAPADLVRIGDRFGYAVPLKKCLWQKSNFISNAPANLRPLWIPSEKPVSEVHGWLDEEQFNQYLQQKDDLQVTDENELTVREHRFGIALAKDRKTVAEGMLYQMEFLRLMPNIGFLLQVSGIDAFNPSEGFLQLGGEARPAHYKVLPTLLPPLPRPQSPTHRLKIILLTPAWFDGGWQPQNGNWGWFFNTPNVRLVAAAVRRPLLIGGAYVDDQKRQQSLQKPIRSFVPPGSVYFFESDDPLTMPDKPFTQTPPSQGDFGQIGFGCIAVGTWDNP
ncbi:MAG: type III-B CRISPR module-associated protein Cmr3 [Armatimonadetes bacterium]|nr:type III-B CRISPR module-associated protein Cmr3 [Armatimonadota bacterium]MDW8121928.1 type III-B CRISPR module-associated protein Cmr3 [Armatimonadota bacterium]